jgi:hypothetical protein
MMALGVATGPTACAVGTKAAIASSRELAKTDRICNIIDDPFFVLLRETFTGEHA